ncbi:DoxX family protein [Teredinibacter haidensis]|uniref:DoxX family protein n=1 Tax=Teredinibacter haidensis TaxID=2731755 RepID=UPI000949147F|nr:DoxX family protein [Teredinibacter haidensis]
MIFVAKHYRLMLSVWIAFVFVQSLFFKFTGSYETQHIFGVLGQWLSLPWFADIGAYLVGAAELMATILLFTRWRPWGALLAFEIMSGAIVFHVFTPLGMVMPAFDSSGQIIGSDGGMLFFMACSLWVSSLLLVVADWLSPNSIIRLVGQKKNKDR